MIWQVPQSFTSGSAVLITTSHQEHRFNGGIFRLIVGFLTVSRNSKNAQRGYNFKIIAAVRDVPVCASVRKLTGNAKVERIGGGVGVRRNGGDTIGGGSPLGRWPGGVARRGWA